MNCLRTCFQFTSRHTVAGGNPMIPLLLDNKVILYSFYESSCAWRVRIALNLKKIPHVIRPVALQRSLHDGEQHTDEFLSINPMGFVPALRIDGVTLVESLNMMHYLAETRPEISLMPKDPIKRARVREISEIISSGIQPMQSASVTCNIDEGRVREWIVHYIEKGFKAVEKLLQVSSGKYCVGDEISIADCCLVPQVYSARKYGVDMGGFPMIGKVDAALQEFTEFLDAHPKNQPDYPLK